MIDLRSDTVTRPTPAMREAMAAAPVGDDVLQEDPTVLRLEGATADLLGKEAALFCPSGTMSNQLGVRVHCGPGDELLCDAQCHIYNYEQAAYAQFFGVAAHPVDGERGLPSAEQLSAAIRRNDIHAPRSRLLCLENTHNRWGGATLPREEATALCHQAADRGLATHLDGARLWNAAVADNLPWRESLRAWCDPFDTVSVCFSKGLGAPVGSCLVGSNEQIALARRVRKALGGGWRQAGCLAAGALHALENHVARLAEDHARAARLAEAIRDTPSLGLLDGRCDTNLVIFEVDPAVGTAEELAKRLADRGVSLWPFGPQRLRAVVHLDINDDAIDRVIEALRQAATIPPTNPA